MKQDWHPDELTQHWTLSGEERALLGNKAGSTRLSFAVLLKTFQFEGHFPERREEVVTTIVFHLADQTGVPPEAYLKRNGARGPSAISAPRFESTAVSSSSMPKMNRLLLRG